MIFLEIEYLEMLQLATKDCHSFRSFDVRVDGTSQIVIEFDTSC
jgi:hypothetical protein